MKNSNFKMACPFSNTFRNSRHARCDPFAKCYKQSQVGVSPSRKNHFVVIYGLRAMNNVTLVYSAPKTMTRAAIKIVSCAAVRALYAVTKIRHAAKIANI